MIDFFCANCGLKFKVNDQFAGRSSRCPTCKEALIVPTPSRTAELPGEIEGTSSSLAQAGVREGVSLQARKTDARAEQRSVRELLERRTANNERYIVDREIARGGMGAVLRAVDCDIRREVAVKYLLDQGDPRKKLRFVEEAQITGQLEHPNIVPIHELSVDGQKKLFFSMKMVRGKSLAQLLDEWRGEPRKADVSLSRMLNIFISVCNALAYAHSCGVIHRDLKPANIMLGDFGEVYVMDWGLAKVLGATGASGTPAAENPSSTSVTASRASKVITSREPEADLTQDGAVMGTPVYMPPEQANGKVNEIDERSDVYSLGAILYEMLALEPPVNKQGGYLAVLVRVVEDEIAPPEKRNPRRAKAGQIPAELSAVALKALNKRPAARYPSVKALRRDIERFQEGRSVSAKRDTMRELAWKLIKRNVAVSMVSVIALLLVTVSWGRSTWLSYQEQKLRREKFVPVFVEAAHSAVQRRQFDQALVQISMAVEYDPEHAEARLLKGQLLIVKGEFRKARSELERYRRLAPGDKETDRLIDICRKEQPGDSASAAELSEVLRRQKSIILAASMVQSREKLGQMYREQIEAAWPGLSANLTMDKNGNCSFHVPNSGQDPKKVIRASIDDLGPLRGIPLTALDLYGCENISDLSPLQGMPLGTLNLSGCRKIDDLTPLAGMPLRTLRLDHCRRIKDLTPLAGMPLKSLDISFLELVNDLGPLQGIPLESLAMFHCGQVKDLKPLRDMPLHTLNLMSCPQVRSLMPLSGMKLRLLNLGSCYQLNRADLVVLSSMPLRSLNLASTRLDDLSFLKGMPLASLDISYCPVEDLNDLRGLPLEWLNLSQCRAFKDLAPLQGMPLTRGINLFNCKQVRDLAPLKKAAPRILTLNGTSVSDITLLAGWPLEELYFEPKVVKTGIKELRQSKTLKLISIVPNDRRSLESAKQFWASYDAGKFK